MVKGPETQLYAPEALFIPSSPHSGSAENTCLPNKVSVLTARGFHCSGEGIFPCYLVVLVPPDFYIGCMQSSVYLMTF